MAYDFPASPSVGTVYSPQGGPSWQWNGTAWVNVSPVSVVSNIVVTVIPGPATGNYVKPAGLKFVEVTCVGGGGAGSRAGITGASTASAGGGGGGGGTCISMFAASDLAASEPYTVGAGGVGSANPGTNGGASSFKGMTANGGLGGGALLGASASPQQSARGSGGAATGGQINMTGGGGGVGEANLVTGGWVRAGHGGASYFAPIYPTTYTTTNYGNLGTTGVGGGSAGGACGFNQASPTNPLDGGSGMIMLKEYY